MNKLFASEYELDDNGWIKFPPDASYRKRMFPPEVNQHPAKANIYLVQSIIEYVSESDELIMDVMAGTGTIMVGALVGRSVICVEISEKFHKLQVAALNHLETIAPGVSGNISLVNLPCQTYLPIPNLVNHIIFSPQYAGIMKKKVVNDQWNKDTGYDFVEYSTNPLNLGTMSEFLWAFEMEKVYKKCFDTIKPGGTMTLILKDHISAGERIGLTDMGIKSSVKVGFNYSPAEHYKWAAPGMPYTSARRARGEPTVDDEDIVVLRKPEVLDESLVY